MPSKFHLPPSAASLSESLRDIGYSLETAVADVIDNSISADATSIQIFCLPNSEEPRLAILDDGFGMSLKVLKDALRHGTSAAKKNRPPGDLGRFGMGLKTASFSQCRRLTVVSSQNGKQVGAEWDLNLVQELDDWMIHILNKKEIAAVPHVDKLGKNGTLVLWRDLDRLSEDSVDDQLSKVVNDKLEVTERHLSLVFHRFLAGEVKGRKKLRISINGHKLKPFDPFCRKNTATQLLPKETVKVDGERITMQPYILPHHSKLTAREYDFYKSRSDFVSDQGAYIYRNGRLMAWGDWFRLLGKGEATKLARVQIDFPSVLDESWTIDIKKSRARPPYQVRERMRQIIRKVTDRSVRAQRRRAKIEYKDQSAPMWDRYFDDGVIQYEVNHDHPVLEAFRNTLDKKQRSHFALLLQLISKTLPTDQIYDDYADESNQITQLVFQDDELKEKLDALAQALFADRSFDKTVFLDVIGTTGLMEDNKHFIENYVRSCT